MFQQPLSEQLFQQSLLQQLCQQQLLQHRICFGGCSNNLCLAWPYLSLGRLQSLISHPATHVRDHQPDDNDNNKVEIEDHFVEVQEGPLVDENYGDNENNLYNQVNMAE